MYNLLIGGAAGDGIETMAGMLEKILLRSGYRLFSMRDFMSRVRGGHNFAQLRFASEDVFAHTDELDGLVVFNEESFYLHEKRLKPTGFVLCDESFDIQHERLIKIDIKGLAKQSGNPKTIGTVAAGALLKLFGVDTASVDATLTDTLKPKILEANKAAWRLGYDALEHKFTSYPGNTEGYMLVTGADCMAMGALAGGVRFYSAYPMSPSTELLSFLTARSVPFKVAVEQAEDEIAAINMALGASYAGARAMVGTSGGGFALMVEALGFAGIAEIPVVMVDMMRPGPATGLPTRTEQSDLSFVISAAQGEFPRFVMAPRDHADAFYQTARAFYIAEKYQIPVIILGDQYLADSATTLPKLDWESAQLPPPDYSEILPEVAVDTTESKPMDPATYKRYALTPSGVSPMLPPGATKALVRVDSDEHEEDGTITESAATRVSMVNKRMGKLVGLKKELQEPEYVGSEHPELLLLGFGSTAAALREAVATLYDASPLRPGALLFSDIYPLPTKRLEKYAINAKKIINVEQNATGQLARLISAETQITMDDSLLKYDGRQLSVDEIVYGVGALLI